MPTIGQTELRVRAGEYIARLTAEGISSSLDEASFRDYLVKVRIGGKGAVKLYYKPSKRTFTADFGEVTDKTAVPALEDAWHGHSGEHGYRIYVDGSRCNNITGYAFAVVKDHRVVFEHAGVVDETLTAESAQIAGELRAATEAVEWCRAQGIGEIELHYDYAGIEKWASGEWKANHAVSQAYAGFFSRNTVRVKWVKVAAHSGDRWNSHVDKLARQACSIRNE
jgi:ribonuclease HI